MIYVDMDGVIADFKQWISSYEVFTEDDWSNTNKPWALMDEHIDTIYTDLYTLPDIVKFNDMYNSMPGQVKFLSALPHTWYDNKFEIGYDNKAKWLHANIDNFKDGDLICTRGSNDKIRYCDIGDTLYDDRIDIIERWNDAGGIGIHVKN